MAAARTRKTDAHGNFIEKKRWTKRRALQEQAKLRTAVGNDRFGQATEQLKPTAPARAAFGQRTSSLLTLLVNSKAADK